MTSRRDLTTISETIRERISGWFYSPKSMFATRPPPEFGKPMWRNNVFRHEMTAPDGTPYHVVSYNGHRVIEVYPDYEVYLLIPPDWTGGVQRTWEMLLSGISISSRKKTKAVGTVERTLLWGMRFQLKDNPHARKWVTMPEVTAHRRFRLVFDAPIPKELEEHVRNNNLATLVPDVAIEPADRVEEITVYKSDQQQYKEFCAKLKRVRVAILTANKMGAFDDLYDANNQTIALHKRLLITQGGKLAHLERSYIGRNAALTSLIESCALNDDNTALEPIVILSKLTHYTQMGYQEERKKEGFREATRRQVTNALKRAQLNYLREKCVSIDSSDTPQRAEDDSTDQDRELLPSD